MVRVADAGWRADVSGGAFLAASTLTLPHRQLGHSCCPAANDGLEADFGAGGAYALGAGYGLTDQIEAVVRYQHALSGRLDRAVKLFGDYRLPTEYTTGSRLDVFSVAAGGRLYLLPSTQAYRPWIVGEVGWYHAAAEVDELACGRSTCERSDVRDTGNDDGVGVNAGAGFDVRLTDMLSVGLDVRYHRAFVLGDFGFLTTMATLGVHF